MNKNRLFYKWAATTIITAATFCCVHIINAAEGHDFTNIPVGAEYKSGELLVRFAPKPDGRQRTLVEKNPPSAIPSARGMLLPPLLRES